ncbi:DUF3800 domain-containing protein [Sphingomonas sp. Leaf343]|uniref:DUF3800 domain-containing protein n=1 Tax=Sphingomonas sp. Leaf343 TaxID=1736345 RepID=UPI0009EA1CB2|nr:DUF3800 domain-containing protein [Sphingomonas sp. Leaf343]
MAEPAGDSVRALVSGFPRKRRERQLIAMLQMFVDDSGINQPPIYCLAGWIATASQWALFSDDWQAVLDEEPKLDYFHAVEWKRLGDAFRGWQRSDADAKLEKLIATISKHKLIMSSSIMLHEHYIEVFGDTKDVRRRFPPYQMLLNHLVIQTADWLRSKGRTDKLDIIFDSQMSHDKIVLGFWDDLVANTFDDIGATLSNSPIFRNDKDVVGLQAADLLAWTIRRSNVNHMKGLPIPHDLWKHRKKDAGTAGVVHIINKLVMVNMHLTSFYQAMVQAGIYPPQVMRYDRKLLAPSNWSRPEPGNDHLPLWQ